MNGCWGTGLERSTRYDWLCPIPVLQNGYKETGLERSTRYDWLCPIPVLQNGYKETGLERSTRYYWLCPVSFSMQKLDWNAAHATIGCAPSFSL